MGHGSQNELFSRTGILQVQKFKNEEIINKTEFSSDMKKSRKE